MRNKISTNLAFALLFVFTAVSAPAHAQNLPPIQDSGLFFGQSHSYTVVFRGNGEAIVFGRMSIINSEDSDLDKFVFEIPAVTATELVFLQQKTKPVCTQYDYQGLYDPVTGLYPCFNYQETGEYYSGNAYPYFGPSEYQKVKYSQTGSIYTLTLPTPIAPGKTGSILFSYAAFGYAQNHAGLFKFNFQTPKVSSRVSLMRVAVDVDSDLYLEGKKSQVQYNMPSQEAFRAAPSGVNSLGSPALDNLSTSVGNYGSLIKEAKSLAPNESLIVKGKYSASKIRLYMDGIVWTLVMVVLLLIGLWKWRKYMIKNRKAQAPASKLAVPDNVISILNFTNAATGFLSAVLVVILTYVVKVLSRSDFFRYIDDEFLAIIIVIMAGLLYVLAIFGPAILVGNKHGVKSGISVLIAEFLWFVLLLFLFVLLFKSGLAPDVGYPGPMYR